MSGWFKGEALSLGATWLEHGERYRQSEEFIDVLRGAWTTDDFTYRGDFFRTRDLTFRPQPDVLPEVFQGGNSTAARQMAGRASDWYFMNGSSSTASWSRSRRSAGTPPRTAAVLRFGLNGFAVVRDTEAEAEAGRRRHRRARRRREGPWLRRGRPAGRAVDARRQGDVGRQHFTDLVQQNDGFRTGLVGTPEQLARRIASSPLVGVDLLLLGFLHVREEVQAFGERVDPAGPCARGRGRGAVDPVAHLGLEEELAGGAGAAGARGDTLGRLSAATGRVGG